MSKFETAYDYWLKEQRAAASGERLRRLMKGHGYGEKLLLQQAWWPVFGNFDHLVPEFEFVDDEGNHYFMDLVYVRSPRATCLESDSFGIHARDADRDSFSRGLERQNAILLSDWNILRFSIDKLKEDPGYGQRTLRKMVESWYGEDPMRLSGLNVYEREIVRLATRSIRPFNTGDACELVEKSDRFVRDLLHGLVGKGIIEPASGASRVRSYRLAR
ncbi:DNA-binding response regulator [Cohnella yongneupensis]|uniref:DNA-binding response regulator n=1 Tax=Cohnella yongneupensis TaxID=425006 RepID=A0ABW0R0S0_9BACL